MDGHLHARPGSLDLWTLLSTRSNRQSCGLGGVISVNDKGSDKFECSSCERAKTTATGGSGSLRKADNYGERIHSDVAGPFPAGRRGLKYLGVFVSR